MNQNSYGKTQYCCICKKPLEKARVVDRGMAKCNECHKKAYKQYLEKKKTKV